MTGQGRPRASRALAALRAGPGLRWAVQAVLALALVISARGAAAESVLRLRIAWGGGVARNWEGNVRLSEGQLSDLIALGIETDEPGSIWLDDRQVSVHPPSPRAYDGFDVSVRADAAARLVVDLASNSKDVEPLHVELALRDLLAGTHTSTMDSTGNRLLITRSPGDKLRVKFARDALVFAPGESFPLEVEPQLGDAPPGTALQVRAALVAAAGGGRVWSQELSYTVPEEGHSADPLALEVPLPKAEGVYDLVLEAQSGRLGTHLLRKKPLAERKVQLVVLDKQRAAAPPGGQSMTKVLEIDPANPRWKERLTNIPLMPSLRKVPLASGDAAPWEHPRLGTMMRLGPAGRAPDISWEAYPLPLSNPGQPHILEIEYPSDVPQTMGISLLEPNAAGAVMPIGLDSGVHVSEDQRTEPAHLARHRVVFWPRTKAPLLLVSNRRDGWQATYGKIRVLSSAAPHGQFSTLTLTRAEGGSAFLPRAFATPAERLLAGYLDRPLFNENFSATEALDTASGRSLDDWTTFYQGGNRLVEYLNYAGFGGLMMSVVAEGSAIYPAPLVEPTPRYDTGAFFAVGQDPVRKDALELLFRLFDREGLQLIPAVQFTAPLPELEALRRVDAEGLGGVEWVGADGVVRPGKQQPKRSAPFYNPLDPRVQKAMLAVIQQLAARYGSHPSFGGVALQLSADGFAQLPPIKGGYDDATIARFVREAKIEVPGKGPARFAARDRFLSDAAARAWLNWRAECVADFHRRAAEVVVRSHSGAKLYLAGAHMLDHAQLQASLRPSLPARTNVDAVLLSLGIVPALYRQQEHVVFLRPQRVEAGDNLASTGVDLELNHSPDVDRTFSIGHDAGSLFYHEPQKARLASFDAKSPFGAASTYTWLVSQISPSGDRNRQRFAHSLATLDAQEMFDGGWLLPLGQEDALREMVGVYRQLPLGRFQTLSGDTQPVTIRTRSRERDTVAYLVNDSPWSVGLRLDVDMPSGCRMERLGTAPAERDGLERGPQGAVWSLRLKPYDLVAVRFSAPGVQLSHPQVKLGDEVRAALEHKIQDLKSRAEALLNPSSLLENAGFEEPGEAPLIPGWAAPRAAEASAVVDDHEKNGGARSLLLSSRGETISLRSNSFRAPQTGRLWVSVRLRVAEGERQPPLRLALEGKLENKEYYRFAAVGSAGPGAVPLASQWAPYEFLVDDLPAEGLSELKVRFDLLGAGKVWIDDVELFEFSNDERIALTKIITLANFKLQAGQMADCARLLEGYWPQFLVTNVAAQPRQPIPVAQRTKPVREPSAAPEPPAKKGVIERMKGFVKPLQF